MGQLDMSKAQQRALKVLGVHAWPDMSYQGAGDLLQRAGAPGSGVPAGYTWRTAAKLSDEELRGLLKPGRAKNAH